jgi:Exonuclease III
MAPPTQPMKIATYNVNSLRKRLPIVLEWLDKQKPDVLCLQETKVQDSEFPLIANLIARGL